MSPTARVVHPNVALVQDYLAALARGDLPAAQALLADDLVYTVPGENRLAGVRRGRSSAGAWFADMQAAAGGSYRVRREVDWLAAPDSALLLAEEEAVVAGRDRAWLRAVFFAIGAGQMRRISLFEDDTRAHDDWLGRGRPGPVEGSDSPAPAPGAAPMVTGDVADPRVQAVLAYQRHLMAGELAAARRVFHEDVRYTVPGRSLLAGTYLGPEAVMGYLGRVMALTGGTYAISRMHWLTSGERVALLSRNHASRAGRSLSWDEVIVFCFVDGRKQAILHFMGDPYGFDALFAAEGPV